MGGKEVGAGQINGSARRVLVVTDQSGVVYALRRMLRQTPGFALAGYVDGRNAVGNVVRQARADVVIVDDLGAPELALKRVAEVHEAAPAAKTVLLVTDTAQGWVEDAVAAGAQAVLSKSIDPVSAATLLREIVRGTVIHCLADTTVRAGRMRTGDDDPSALGLTQRELELLRLVASGATNSRLARQLFVTEQTIKFHLSNIYRKLGVANRTQASRFAHTHGLVPPVYAIPQDELDDVAVTAA